MSPRLATAAGPRWPHNPPPMRSVQLTAAARRLAWRAAARPEALG